MLRQEFEDLLNETASLLTSEARSEGVCQSSREFEDRARRTLKVLGERYALDIDFNPHPHVFPDIALNQFGVEVKFTTKDTWRSVANSVFESTRSLNVSDIYILFGKMGGVPEVRWGKYEDCVMHVRTSHVPRFEVELFPEKSLFEKMGITYREFCELPSEGKMHHIREYARGRLKPGDRLWWLEEKPEQEHSLPLQVRLYMNLTSDEKRMLRSEAALLCPQIVKPPGAKKKYDDAALYLLTYHGVLCPQARDLFSAGSVALRSDDKRGGNYVERALRDLESQMEDAAQRLEPELFVEYWGEAVPPDERIQWWLKRADLLAKGWVPSKSLFLHL